MVKKKNYYKKYGTLFSGESNPFNVKINRKKHAVLGSDVKGTKGLPVVSRGLNYAKRKEFLKKNKVAAQKSNTYIDKRTKNPNMFLEDKVTAKFMREHQKGSKKSVFNLSGDQELKCKAKQNFGSVSSDEDEKDILGATFKGQGGFASDNNFEAPKSHKEIIEEMIADSKQKKMERKMEKEKYLNSLEEVDNAWREIHLSSSKTHPSSNASKILTKEPVESKTKDLYDITRNELKFEQKCSISHSKSEAEIAEEELKKLTQLEKEKLHRMNESYELKNVKTSNHISADAICDEYEYLQPELTTEDKSELPDRSNVFEEEFDDSESSSEEMDEDEEDLQNQNVSSEEDDFFTDIPSNLNDFKIRVKGHGAEELTADLENILRKYVRSKNEKVLIKLENFFEILMQFTYECCEKKLPKLDLIGVLPPHLHSLANAVNLGTAHRFLKFLNEEQQIFTAFKKRRMKKNFPRLQTVTFLKYATLIYSTSDFRHPVVTPVMIFMCDILGSPFCNTFANILSRLLISELILNCIAESKRFVPEAVCFLNNILQLAIPPKLERKENQPSAKLFNLVITDKVSTGDILTLDLFSTNEDLTDENKKISVIFTVTNQLLQFATLYSSLPSFKEIFTSILTVCDQLPTHFYPVLLETQIKKLLELGQKSVPLCQLSFQKAKPKPLKMFEPAFESKFNQKDDINKKRRLIKKVAQKIKKEEKSMLREIRRDAQVAASEKLKEKMEFDAERKRKVKEIYGSLSVQEGEFKKMMKKKS